jgi:thioredoxin 1
MELPAGVAVTTAADWEASVMAASEPVVVGFWAEWCIPCRMAAPAFESAARHYGRQVRFALVNVDEEPALASRYEVKGLPSVLVMKRGEVCQRRVGLMGRAALRALVDGCLG